MFRYVTTVNAKINPQFLLKFESTCINCEQNEVLTYKWTLFGKTKGTTSFTEVNMENRNLTTTGIFNVCTRYMV